MYLRHLTVLPLLAASAFAQTTLSVDKLVEFVRSSIKLSQPDKDVAGLVTHFRLSQKLEPRIIEELQGEGAGPRTVAALRSLAAGTASLTAPAPKPAVAPAPEVPPPPYEEQQKIIQEVREYALNYSQSLPNFICTQVTRRFYDPTGHESWRSADTITAKLSYFEQKEKYDVQLINNSYVQNRSMESLGGATSSGEFGSMLKQVFEPGSEAEFHWDHWGKLRGHITYVFNYRVEQSRSQWMIDYEHKDRIMPAYQGLLYVDKDTRQVLRITLQAIELPASFPVQEARTRLDYDYTEISGQKFLVPLVAQVRMRAGNYLSRNDTEFRFYRKYGVESTITFTPDALDETQTQEKPPSEKSPQ